ncbi:MAG: hypothetical protein WKF37_21400, partial [Bryobacteraceae bacterium]
GVDGLAPVGGAYGPFETGEKSCRSILTLSTYLPLKSTTFAFDWTTRASPRRMMATIGHMERH